MRLLTRNTMERALLNLVINARDACGPDDRIVVSTGHRTVTGEDASSARAEGEYLTLTVSDTGVGMSDDVLAHVFDVYFTTKPVGEGSGLGLPQVHSAVTQAGGFVTVTSAAGQGACFELALPRVVAADRTADAAQRPAEQGARHRRRQGDVRSAHCAPHP